MSRWEFMRQLEKLLSDISPNEREEALQYYNDYFNDAGMENEQEVIKALGSPEQVAKIVKDGLGEGGNQGEFTENGFLNSAVRQNELMKKEAASGRDAGAVQEGEAVKEDGSTFGQNTDTFGDGYSQSSDDTRKAYDSFGQSNTGSGETEKEKKDLPVWAIVLIVFACILGSPVILGLACGALGLIIGVFTAVLATVFGIGLAAVICFIVAVALAIAGFGILIPHPFEGIGLLGGGFICGALGILFMLLTVLLVTKVLPAICQGIASIYNSIFRKKGGAKR
jgi:Predicted membrane protein